MRRGRGREGGRKREGEGKNNGKNWWDLRFLMLHYYSLAGCHRCCCCFHFQCRDFSSSFPVRLVFCSFLSCLHRSSGSSIRAFPCNYFFGWTQTQWRSDNGIRILIKRILSYKNGMEWGLIMILLYCDDDFLLFVRKAHLHAAITFMSG